MKDRPFRFLAQSRPAASDPISTAAYWFLWPADCVVNNSHRAAGEKDDTTAAFRDDDVTKRRAMCVPRVQFHRADETKADIAKARF